MIQLSDIHFIVKTRFGISAAYLFFFYTVFKLKGKHIQLHLQKPCSSVNMRSTKIKSNTTITYWQSLWQQNCCVQKKQKKGSILSVSLLKNQQSFNLVLNVRHIQLVNMHVCFENKEVKRWKKKINIMDWQHIHNNINAFLRDSPSICALPKHYSENNDDFLLYWRDITTY